MATNTRFAVALHVLTALAMVREPRTSEQLAEGTMGTHPAVLRRILSKLSKAGLVETRQGKFGGVELARAPEKITLGDVYRALGEREVLAVHELPENPACPVSCHIKPALMRAFERAEAAIERSLDSETISDLLKDVRKGLRSR